VPSKMATFTNRLQLGQTTTRVCSARFDPQRSAMSAGQVPPSTPTNPGTNQRASGSSGQAEAEALASLKRTLLVAALETPYAATMIIGSVNPFSRWCENWQASLSQRPRRGSDPAAPRKSRGLRVSRAADPAMYVATNDAGDLRAAWALTACPACPIRLGDGVHTYRLY
jgi:hypothetical protein